MTVTTKQYIFACLLCLLFAACNNNSNTQQQQRQTIDNNVQPVLSEGFEHGNKSSYTSGTVRLSSGTWFMADGLIASTAQDAKAGEHAVRLRNKGLLRMNFDVNGASKVTVKQAAYAGSKTSGWQLQMSVDGGRSFTPVGANMVASGNSLQTVTSIVNYKGAVRFAIAKTAGGANRINIDDFTIFGFGAKPTAETLPNKELISSGDTAVTGDNTNLLLGNPSNAAIKLDSINNYLIVKPYYTMSYSRTKGKPNWVSWYVGSEWLGHVKRLNDFRADDALPKGWYRVQNTSYQGSGFERGHNCPSADRTNSLRANSATFLMSNMIPQAPANNQFTWGNLENYERALVKRGNEVYVIMGSYGVGGYGTRGFRNTIDSGRITVPAYIWKVVVVLPNGNNDLKRVDATTRVIAITTPNNNAVNPNWTNYLCTVRDIEKATGYNLLSKLPKAVQDVIETRKDFGIDPDDGYLMRL